MNKMYEFERELGLIKDVEVKNFAEYVLGRVPAYFWFVPSSSTGKYHPAQSNGEGGLVRHTKSIVYFTDIFCRAYAVEGKQRDLVLTASLLHDILKYGMALGKHTTKDHDKAGADFVLALGKEYMQDVGDSRFTKEDLVEICRAIAFHMGRWTTSDRAKAFPQEYTTSELIVHLADMASAGKEVNLEFMQESMIG